MPPPWTATPPCASRAVWPATRKAVVTQGADATVIATSGKGVETVPVAGNPWSLKKEDLVDTSGAADASQKRPAAGG